MVNSDRVSRSHLQEIDLDRINLPKARSQNIKLSVKPLTGSP